MSKTINNRDVPPRLGYYDKSCKGDSKRGESCLKFLVYLKKKKGRLWLPYPKF